MEHIDILISIILHTYIIILTMSTMANNVALRRYTHFYVLFVEMIRVAIYTSMNMKKNVNRNRQQLWKMEHARNSICDMLYIEKVVLT